MKRIRLLLIKDDRLEVKVIQMETNIRITKPELEVIESLGEGMTIKEIGQEIYVLSYQVNSHIHNLIGKLALKVRLEIANYSYIDKTVKTIPKSISMVNN